MLALMAFETLYIMNVHHLTSAAGWVAMLALMAPGCHVLVLLIRLLSA